MELTHPNITLETPTPPVPDPQPPDPGPPGPGPPAPPHPDPEPPAPEPSPQPSPPEIRGWDEIACDGCGRSFLTSDGPEMLRAIKGNCADCGGRFQLLGG